MANEQTSLLHRAGRERLGSIISTLDERLYATGERKLLDSHVGERLPYNDYTTIDWLHDLVEDSYRLRFIHSRPGLKYALIRRLDQASGWIAAALIGALTACVAFLVDVAAATVSDWKSGYCKRNMFLSRETCCTPKAPLLLLVEEECADFRSWSSDFGPQYAVYVAAALVFGVLASSVTLLSKQSLPATSPGGGDKYELDQTAADQAKGKTMYMAAGSGIPEIKTILSGFAIPHVLTFKVMAIKAIGAVFAVATGMALGKEGPFVHISTCVGSLVARCLPKYRNNGRKFREMLSAACASGLSVAFGAPIGGVLFSYEEISSYFPRKVLWRAFLCSLIAAMVLKSLNPNGTGKLVLFETHYGTSYDAVHYLIFLFLGICGGLFGGLFCKLNFLWSKWFRGFGLIKNNPVLEVVLVVAVTALVQFPSPLIRHPGDTVIKNLLVDCREDASSSWVCEHESSESLRKPYVFHLLYGTLAKLVLVIITFGVKVPSGVIIPALDAGALFGRLVGQAIGSVSPGIFAMVGAAAFLAGVSRMTLSLCVIMFELTGELEYVPPHMLAILVAKWVADSISSEGVYDLAQTVLGHPFLDLDHSMQVIQKQKEAILANALLPPEQTMEEIKVHVPSNNLVAREVLQKKLNQLRARGLMDAGLVLVGDDVQLRGYLGQAELEYSLVESDRTVSHFRLFGDSGVEDIGAGDMSDFVDRTPIALCATAPVEYVVEMFGKLGLRHLILIEEGTRRVEGVVIKKRLVAWLDCQKH